MLVTRYLNDLKTSAIFLNNPIALIFSVLVCPQSPHVALFVKELKIWKFDPHNLPARKGLAA